MRPQLLFEPGRIGPVTTRNRMIKTANGTSFMEDDQTVGERMVAYYERLARGGVGFLVVESCGVEYPLGIQHVHYRPDGSYQGVQLHLDDDRFIEGFSRLTEAVHRHDCPVSIQLQHSGPWNPTGLLPRDPELRDVKCASALTEEELPGPDFLPCRAMTREEIEDQIDLWASAAERAYKAGFDAVEMNHGTCHQGNTFLSRVWNRRDDEYGPQSLENRTRFLRDIITETKRRCGPGFAVHALINIAEYNHPLATTIDEGAGMAVLIGEVADGINCRAERYGHRGGLLQPDRLFYPEPPIDLPAGLDWSRKGVGATIPLTEACKRAGVTVPVWTACRLDPDLGEECLRRGSLDFVGMTRRLLADPDLPRKLDGGPRGGHPPLSRLPALLRHAQPQQEARVPRQRHAGARDRPGVHGPARSRRARRCWSSGAAPPAWRPPASPPGAATRSRCTSRTTASAGWCLWRRSSRTSRRRRWSTPSPTSRPSSRRSTSPCASSRR